MLFVEQFTFWSFVRRHRICLIALAVGSILILREGGVVDLTFFKRIADGSSTLINYGDGYRREQIDHLSYEDISSSAYTIMNYGPRANKGTLLVREYVGCDTPWTSWIPFCKWGRVHVFRIFRLIDDKGLSIASGSQEFISNVSVTGICSHRRLVEDVEQAARHALLVNLRAGTQIR